MKTSACQNSPRLPPPKREKPARGPRPKIANRKPLPRGRYSPGEVVAPAGPAPCAAFFLVRAGDVLLMPPGAPSPSGRLTAGDLHNEGVLTSPAAPLAAALVAGPGGAVVITFELASLNKALAGPGGRLGGG